MRQLWLRQFNRCLINNKQKVAFVVWALSFFAASGGESPACCPGICVYNLTAFHMCGHPQASAHAGIVAVVFQILALCLAIAACAGPIATVKIDNGRIGSYSFSGTLAMTLSELRCTTSSGSKCDGSPILLSEIPEKDFKCNSLPSSSTTTVCAILKAAQSLASASLACFSIGIILGFLMIGFAISNVVKKMQMNVIWGAKIPSTPGCLACASHCASSIVPAVFTFILFIIGSALSFTACAPYLVWIIGSYTFSGKLPLVEGGSGYVAGIIGVIASIIAMIVDASGRCACCNRSNGLIMAPPQSGSVVIMSPVISSVPYGSQPMVYGAQPMPMVGYAPAVIQQAPQVAVMQYSQPAPQMVLSAAPPLPQGWTQVRSVPLRRLLN